MKRNRAFTLIELLVVIAIIAILAAILFPVFAQAKNAAKTTQAVSHMKQIGTGLSMYLNDNDDAFPLVRFGSTVDGNGNTQGPWLSWKYSIYTYIKNRDIFKDPVNIAAQLGDEQSEPKTPAGGTNTYYNASRPFDFKRGYFYYRAFHVTGGWQDAAPYTSGQIQEPAGALIISENKDFYADYGPWMAYIPKGTGVWKSGSNWGGGKMEDKSFVTVFADTHAKLIPMRASCGKPGQLNAWQYDPGADLTKAGPGGADIDWMRTFCRTLPF